MGKKKRELLFILLQSIPVGKVTTYKSLARILKTSPRALGRMLRENDRPVIVPCHRVVRSTGEIGGYTLGRKTNREFKLKLLRLEGVVVSGGKVDPESIVSLDEMFLERP